MMRTCGGGAWCVVRGPGRSGKWCDSLSLSWFTGICCTSGNREFVRIPSRISALAYFSVSYQAYAVTRMSDLPEGKPTATKKNGRTGFSETIGNMPFMRRSVNKSLETIQDRKKRQEQEILHKEETLNFLDNVADGILGVSKESGASNDRGKKSLVFVMVNSLIKYKWRSCLTSGRHT